MRVRLLLADFDPLFASRLHRAAWESASHLAKAAPQVEIICARHPAQVGPFWRGMIAPIAHGLLRKHRAAGLDTPPLRAADAGDWGLNPVTLHQKFAVADGARAVIGGIDVDERRWDDPLHARPAEQTWHDVSVALAGGFCTTLDQHFASCWQLASGDSTAQVSQNLSDPAAVEPEPEAGRALLRTLSEPKADFFGFGPRTTLSEHEAAHLEAIRNAERCVYLETQFFRHRPLAKALAAAARRNPALNLVLLLPSEPERIAFDGNRDPGARHEQALQRRCIAICRRAFGPRMALVSPAQPVRAGEADERPLRGAPIVYVHSKITIIDDTLAIVGSANLNGRSMRWDTEASVMSTRADDVSALRERLGNLWLRTAARRFEEAQVWREVAEANAAQAPSGRDGFLLPYPAARAARFSLYLPVMPDEMF